MSGCDVCANLDSCLGGSRAAAKGQATVSLENVWEAGGDIYMLEALGMHRSSMAVSLFRPARVGDAMAEVYVGRRFRSVFVGSGPAPPDVVQTFREAGRRLAALGLAPGHSGYLALRDGRGTWIKAGGVGLGALDALSVVEVVAFEVPAFAATVRGQMEPSSETPMAAALFAMDARIGGIVHVHAPAPRSDDLPFGVARTANEEPYGTPEMARSAVQAFTPGIHTVWLADHGYVSIGGDIAAAEDACVSALRSLHPGMFDEVPA